MQAADSRTEGQPAGDEPEVFSRLRQAARAAGMDALVALSQDNVTYTAGFLVPSHATNRFRRTISVLAGDRFACQIVVSVEELQARARSRFRDVRAYDQFSDDPADSLADALIEAGVAKGRIGIELDFLPAMDYLRLRSRLPDAEFVACRDLYFKARMAKTGDEIATLRRVGALTETVMRDVFARIEPGMTELQIASQLMNGMIEGGSTNVKYRVGSGINGSVTNCGTTDKKLESGDIVRIEVLGDLDNYRSNVTRTLVVGKPHARHRDIYARIIEVRDECRAMLRPGLAVPELYRAFVAGFRRNGMEPTLRFLGHGIGQTIHEEPYITNSREIVFEPNFTFTMEPVFMIPGDAGFHTEDMYTITERGFDHITGTIVPNDTLIEVGS